MNPTIPEDVCINFKTASQKDKQKVREILIQNYTNLVDEMFSCADYASTTGYWKDNTPLSKKIITAKKFISKYDKKVDKRKLK